jgi:transposase
MRLWLLRFSDRQRATVSNPSPPLGISEEDWSATPVAVRVVVMELLQRVARLEARLNQTSRNSSKPPSSDPPQAKPRAAKEPTGRKSGGQPGHEGHGRKLKPESEVDQIIDVRPEHCGQCGTLLLGEDAEPERHQVTELPRIAPVVTEYRRHCLWCVACGVRTQAVWPATMPTGSFGPRVQATVGYLTGRLGASQREVQDLFATLYQTDVSVGGIGALEQAVSAALAAPVAEAQMYVERQPVRNADETSWPEKTQRRWLWISVTPLVTIFRLLQTRGAAGAKELLGEVVWGIIGTDHYAGYHWIDPRQRQLCWAHLKREFVAWSERTGETARIGLALLAVEKQLFALWYRVRDGTVAWADFQVAMRPLMARVSTLFQEGVAGADAKARGPCRNLLKREAALWTFVWETGVEPTNNCAERPLRRAVLWRRRSFGTQSAAGSQFVERILTAVTTLRQQRRNVLDYLTAACTAAIRHEPAPSLLPLTAPSLLAR